MFARKVATLKEDLNKQGPVFVVGMNGSGTTLLLDCLDNHSELYGFRRETRILPYFINALGQYGDLDDDAKFLQLWEDFRSSPDFRLANSGQLPPIPENWRELPRTLATVVDQVFMYFAKQSGKSRWCEKTPMHALHISSIRQLFPNAKFLHVIRDGRSCAASFHRRWKHTPELTLYRWKNVLTEARRQGKEAPKQYFELKYEDLIEDSERWMRQICNFLSLPFEESVLTPSRKRPVTTGSVELKIVSKQPTWRVYFSDQKLRRLEDIGGKVLRDLGYEPIFEAGDSDPAAPWRKYWLYRDYLRLGISDMKDILTGKSKSSWKELFARVKVSIRQRITTKY
jgi:hypothetical protein